MEKERIDNKLTEAQFKIELDRLIDEHPLQNNMISKLYGAVERLKQEIKEIKQVNRLKNTEDNSIIATIQNTYQLEDYEFKGKILTVFLLEFKEYTDRLYLHRIKGNLEGLTEGSKVIFKVDGDKVKDLKVIKNIIS